MKSKFYKLIGIALTVVLLASLTVGLAGVPAGADTSNLKFTKLDLPQVEAWTIEADFAVSEGDYWVTPDIDVGPIAISPDGEVLFASVYDDGDNFYEILKSLDGGYSWTVTGFYDEAFTNWGDNFPIVDIVTSPEYGDDTTIVVATTIGVYISDDGGKNFINIGWSSPNTDLDVTITDDEDLAIMVGLTGGEVFIKKGLLGWTAQNIAAAYPGYDVLACNFLPTFSADGNIGISAVISDGSTTMMTFSFEDIDNPSPLGGWNVSGIADAPITDAEGNPFPSVFARAAFPDDFDSFGIGNNVCFVGVATTLGAATLPLTPPDGSDAYKIVLKEAGTSSAVDLDVRGVQTTLLPTSTAVTSIEVCGNAEGATILVGTDTCNLTDTPMYFFTYRTDDSGETWVPAMKSLTGGDEVTPNLIYINAMTQVLMAPDFCSGSTAYASTQDNGNLGFVSEFVGDAPNGTSAFQRTTDGAESWNQISIIDYAYDDDDYWINAYGFSATGFIADGTLRMITSLDETPFNSVDGAMWQRFGEKHWERILSYATPGVTDSLFQISAPMDGSALFAVDLANACMWRSTDGGVTWPKKINTKPGLQWVTAVSATNLYTSHIAALANNSGIWWTTKSGTGWNKPDDSEIPNTAVVPSVSVMGDVVICSTFAGEAYISSDGGETVEKVGKNTPGRAGGPNLVTADLGFAGNGILYYVSLGPPAGHGVWRTSVDLADPGACKWERIDNNQDSTGAFVYDETNVICGSPAITLPMNGILYVADGSAVNTATPDDFGGLWRCTNPTADLDSTTPPYFERETKGLVTGDSIGLKSLDLAPPTLAPTFFCNNNTPAFYWEQMVMFTDILNVGVPLAVPEADAVGVGLLPEGAVYPQVALLWQEMAGARSYEFQVAIDPDFKTKIPPGCGFTDSLSSGPMNLDPNMTYYWRVRVANELPTTLLGAPLISPWSETFKFKTAIGASMARPRLEAPDNGEFDIPLSPTFEWSGIEWAEVYEYELGLDPTTTAGGYFAEPLVALVGTNSLVSTAWKCDTTLDYETRYYWHVKAIGVDTDTPWSDVGTFTTMGVPPTTPTPVPPVEIPPAQNITPAWIWAIVIIGAILVIAVVVLIVTTRRVP